jgi:hypothetical protein
MATAAAAVAATAVIGAMSAAPAYADQDGTCDTGDTCMWDDFNFVWDHGYLDLFNEDSDFSFSSSTQPNRFYTPGDGASEPTGVSVNDNVSSFWNYDNSCTVNLYANAGFNDRIAWSGPNNGIDRLTVANNEISSLDWSC